MVGLVAAQRPLHSQFRADEIQIPFARFRQIVTPVFEDTALFARTAGETSDVVSKEMYSFLDRSERALTLRPEGTAPVMRATGVHCTRMSTPFRSSPAARWSTVAFALSAVPSLGMVIVTR